MRTLATLMTAVLFLTGCGVAQAPDEATGPGTEPAAELVARRSAGCGVAPPVAAGESGRATMSHGGLERGYVLHLPPGYAPDTPVSLVLDFHGYGGDGASEERYTRLSPHADRHGYAVVYPDSTAFLDETGNRVSSWNDLAGSASPGPEGPICAEDAAAYPHPPECGDPTPCNWASCNDDLAFVSALLDSLEQQLCVDRDRVYATGMSNGGMFVHRLGCDMPDRFAAIAPVGGTLARGFNCAPEGTALSMMNVYGRNDRYVDEENARSSDGYYYTAAADVMARWAAPESQSCAAESTPYVTSRDGALGLTCTQRADCTTGAEVVTCSWEGAHDWPRADGDDVANDVIWEFFSKHRRR